MNQESLTERYWREKFTMDGAIREIDQKHGDFYLPESAIGFEVYEPNKNDLLSVKDKEMHEAFPNKLTWLLQKLTKSKKHQFNSELTRFKKILIVDFNKGNATNNFTTMMIHGIDKESIDSTDFRDPNFVWLNYCSAIFFVSRYTNGPKYYYYENPDARYKLSQSENVWISRLLSSQ